MMDWLTTRIFNFPMSRIYEYTDIITINGKQALLLWCSCMFVGLYTIYRMCTWTCWWTALFCNTCITMENMYADCWIVESYVINLELIHTLVAYIDRLIWSTNRVFQRIHCMFTSIAIVYTDCIKLLLDLTANSLFYILSESLVFLFEHKSLLLRGPRSSNALLGLQQSKTQEASLAEAFTNSRAFSIRFNKLCFTFELQQNLVHRVWASTKSQWSYLSFNKILRIVSELQQNVENSQSIKILLNWHTLLDNIKTSGLPRHQLVRATPAMRVHTLGNKLVFSQIMCWLAMHRKQKLKEHGQYSCIVDCSMVTNWQLVEHRDHDEGTVHRRDRFQDWFLENVECLLPVFSEKPSA